MRRSVLLCACLAVAFLGFVAAPASAQGELTCTPIPNSSGGSGCTVNVQGFTSTMIVAPLACLPGGLITTTANMVFHITINNAGDAWFTTTAAGTFSLLPGTVVVDASGNPVSFTASGAPPFTGQFASWFGGSFNLHNGVFHFVINVQGTAVGGATITANLVFHVNTSATESGANLNLNIFMLATC